MVVHTGRGSLVEYIGIRVLVAVLVATGAGGCAFFQKTFTKLPIPIAALRSPVSLDLEHTTKLAEPANKAIAAEDRAGLVALSRLEVRCRASGAAADCLAGAQAYVPQMQIKFDTFDDFLEKDTLVFLAISGGGARAAALATHTMALLERRYNMINQEALERGEVSPLIDRIDIVSSVSGGSVYAYQLARVKAILDLGSTSGQVGNPALRREIFQRLERLPRPMYKLGYYSALSYLGLGLPPLLTLFTNMNYLDVLAVGLNRSSYVNEKRIFAREAKDEINREQYGKYGHWYKVYSPSYIKLSEISPTPRFFFNATCLETGLPFVFTQRYLHLPSDEGPSKSVRFDLACEAQRQNTVTVPLQSTTTLEELNSSPASVSLAYAAMASAAFPVGLEPLMLKKFGFYPGRQVTYETSERLHVADGGIYDNSGLSSLKDIALYLQARSPKPRRLVVLSINADADEYDLYYPHRIAPRAGGFQESFLDFSLPIRYRSLGWKSIDLIHFVNKRRAEEIAVDAILGLRDSKEAAGFEFFFFPVSLAQLSRYEACPIKDPSNLNARLQEIETNFFITEEDNILLSQAAELLLTAEQALTAAWEIDHQQYKRLEEAFVAAISRGPRPAPGPPPQAGAGKPGETQGQ